MAKKKPITAVFIGAGKLAGHLAKALNKNGVTIRQVVGHTSKNASALATAVGARHTTDLKKTDKTANVYFFAVPDDVIPSLAQELKLPGKLVIHCSGTTDIEVLKQSSEKCAVLYPLQSFTEKKSVDFSKVPVLVEGSDKSSLQITIELAKKLSDKIIEQNSAQRARTHLAAVFASNFTNHMLALSEKILSGNKTDFDVLLPLIHETMERISENSPAEMQTGPAVRGDKKVIKRHLKMLGSEPEIQKVYKVVSKSIRSFHKKPSEKKISKSINGNKKNTL